MNSFEVMLPVEGSQEPPSPLVIWFFEGLPVRKSGKRVPTTFSRKEPPIERQLVSVEGQRVDPLLFRFIATPPLTVEVSAAKFTVSTPALSAEMRSAPQLSANL